MKRLFPTLVLMAGLSLAQTSGPRIATPRLATSIERGSVQVATDFFGAMNARDIAKAGSLTGANFNILEPTLSLIHI